MVTNAQDLCNRSTHVSVKARRVSQQEHLQYHTHNRTELQRCNKRELGCQNVLEVLSNAHYDLAQGAKFRKGRRELS